MGKLRGFIVGAFVLSVIALSIIIYAIPSVTGALTRTDILQYGNLKITDEVTCYFVRNEKVYSAAYSGRINYYVGDGIQVKAGTTILEITPAFFEEAEEGSKYEDIITKLGGGDARLINCISEFNGITSYFVDGYENFFTPDTMRELKFDKVSRLKLQPVNVVRENTLKDEPLYKICENDKWYIICWVEAGKVPKYKMGNNVTINLPLGPVKATVEDIIEDGGKWLIIFRTNRYYEDFGKARMETATVVTADYNGIIVRNESISSSGGAIGVYVKSKTGTYAFKPIKIITSDGHFSLVEVSSFYDDEGNKVSTVEIYDEVLKNPSKPANKDEV